MMKYNTELNEILDELEMLENRNMLKNENEADTKTFKATLIFLTNEEAEEFATAYSRKTLRGHTITQNTVEVYELSIDDKNWIDKYVKDMNRIYKRIKG